MPANSLQAASSLRWRTVRLWRGTAWSCATSWSNYGLTLANGIAWEAKQVSWYRFLFRSSQLILVLGLSSCVPFRSVSYVCQSLLCLCGIVSFLLVMQLFSVPQFFLSSVSFFLLPLDISFSLFVVARGCICQVRSKDHPLCIGNRAVIHFCCVYTAA